MKKLILILIIVFNLSLAYGQTATNVSSKLTPLTKSELSEVSTQINSIMVRTEEKLVESKDSMNGQLLRKYQTVDRNGKKISGRTIEWSYYSGQEGKRSVDIITITEMDGNDKVISTKKLKHFTDGRQPIVK